MSRLLTTKPTCWGRLFCSRDYISDAAYKIVRQTSCAVTHRDVSEDDKKITTELATTDGARVRVTVELIEEAMY